MTSGATTTCPASCADEGLVERVAANLAVVRGRVAALGRDGVRVVAVTKTFPVDHVRAALAAGIDAVGENYAHELADKRRTCGADVEWHFLGAIQTNKARLIAANADVIESVARVRELEALARAERTPPLLVEIDFTGRAGRPGARPDELDGLLEAARSRGLQVRGLMTVAPPEPEGARRAFAALGALADERGLVERSMGMSDDYEIALECGSTEIRVGRALFGPRRTTDGDRDVT